jgi:uncharacterized membrane protein
LSRISPVFFRYLTLGGFFGLFGLMMLWPTVLAASPRFPAALILIATVAPLLPLVRGLLSFSPRSYAWAGFISLPYFVHGTVETYADAGARGLAAAEILFSLMLFFGSALALRSRGKAR